MPAHKKKEKQPQPLRSTTSCTKKSCRKPVSIKLKAPSTVTYDVSEKDAPTPRGPDGRYSGSEVAAIHGAMEVKGNWFDPKGCYVVATRDIHENEVFSCTRVRFELREKGLGGANPWQIRAPHATAEAVCTQMQLEKKKLGKKARKWVLTGHDMWVGPARAGKQAGNNYHYTEMTPPEDRSGELVYRINATSGQGHGGGSQNCRIGIRIARPREEAEGIRFAIPQVIITTTKKIKKGEELLAPYDFRFSLD